MKGNLVAPTHGQKRRLYVVDSDTEEDDMQVAPKLLASDKVAAKCSQKENSENAGDDAKTPPTTKIKVAVHHSEHPPKPKKIENAA